eukprot:s3546_g6.t1
MQTEGSAGCLPDWLASRVRVVASRQSPDVPKRLELSFAGVDLPDLGKHPMLAEGQAPRAVGLASCPTRLGAAGTISI